ncbi:MAG: acyl carrier protein [Myxococcales bacterium]|nr:acyl carrier protein [Myxococcales bacterium]
MALTRESLLEFLGGKTRADLGALDDDAALFSSGLIDSFVMIDLMNMLQKQTGARIAPDELMTLDSIRQILDFAASKAR